MSFSADALRKTVDPGEPMTPELAFVLSLLYMISSDRRLRSQEVGFLLSVVGGIRDGRGTFQLGMGDTLVSRAIAYRSRISVDGFLREAEPILTNDQKTRIVINMADCALSDGPLSDEESRLLGKFVRAFGISKNWFAMILEILVQKNDRTVFGLFGCGPDGVREDDLPGIGSSVAFKTPAAARKGDGRAFEGFLAVGRLRPV
jgi:hypothetical protein